MATEGTPICSCCRCRFRSLTWDGRGACDTGDYYSVPDIAVASAASNVEDARAKQFFEYGSLESANHSYHVTKNMVLIQIFKFGLKQDDDFDQLATILNTLLRL